MKIIQFAVLASILLYMQADAQIKNIPDRAYVPPQTKKRISRHNHGHIHGQERQTPIIISEQDINGALDKLQQEPYSIQKLSALRHLIMRSRRTTVSLETQEKLNTLLLEAHKSYNKEDRRENAILRGTLNMSQLSPLLSENHKDNIKKLLTDIPEKLPNDAHGNSSSNINDLYKIKAQDNYQAKVSSLSQIMRRGRCLQATKNAQSEISAAIHDLYAQRPLDNACMLSKLQSILQQAQSSPLVCTIKQYEVKEIMLPEVTKNIEHAQTLTVANTSNTPDVQKIA